MELSASQETWWRVELQSTSDESNEAIRPSIGADAGLAPLIASNPLLQRQSHENPCTNERHGLYIRSPERHQIRNPWPEDLESESQHTAINYEKHQPPSSRPCWLCFLQKVIIATRGRRQLSVAGELDRLTISNS